MKNKSTLRLVITAVLLAVGLVLPFLLGQVQVLGQSISPLHIPVLICGLTCGWPYGLALGIILPLLRSLLFAMPPMMPTAICMAFEMGVYGLLTGVIYSGLQKDLSKKSNHLPAILFAMIVAMLFGRVVGGAARFVLMGLQGKTFTFAAFWSAYFVSTAIGAVIHIVVVPVVVLALEKAKLSPMTQAK